MAGVLLFHEKIKVFSGGEVLRKARRKSAVRSVPPPRLADDVNLGVQQVVIYCEFDLGLEPQLQLAAEHDDAHYLACTVLC